jgi:endonuclease/exonuclease/phosphatase family metal-dependent hydrolase
MRLKVLTWNILYKDSVFKMDKIVEELKRFDADIICLQEVSEIKNSNNKNIDYLIKQFNDGMFAYANSTCDKKYDPEGKPLYKRIQGNAILTKYKIIDSKENFIITKEELNNRKKSNENRVYLECKIQVADKLINVATTHTSFFLEPEPSHLINLEWNRLLTLLKQKDEKYIFTGDLNVNENSLLVKNMQSFLKHAGPDYIHNTWPTKALKSDAYSPELLNSNIANRIDFIFTSNDIKTINSKLIETHLSDHLPILVEIEI